MSASMLSDQTGHGVGQLVAHGDFAAGVRTARKPPPMRPVRELERTSMKRSPIERLRRAPVRQAVVQGTNDGDTSSLFEGLSAIDAYVAHPTAIMNLAQRRQHRTACVSVGTQDRGHILDHEQVALADLAQQTAGGVLSSCWRDVPTAARLRRRWCSRHERRGRWLLAQLPSGVAGSTDDQQPSGSPGNRSEALTANMASRVPRSARRRTSVGNTSCTSASVRGAGRDPSSLDDVCRSASTASPARSDHAAARPCRRSRPIDDVVLRRQAGQIKHAYRFACDVP